MRSNDVTKFVVGTRLFHRTRKSSEPRIVVIREQGPPGFAYEYEDDPGHVESCSIAFMRQPSKFWPAGDAPPRPFRKVVMVPQPDPIVVEVPAPAAVVSAVSHPAPETFTVEGWPLARLGDEEPRVRDLDLAERLGYARPRSIRKLINSLVDAGKLNDVAQRHVTERREGQVAPQTVPEHWLTEAQALKVAAHSETKPADALLDEMIHVFMLARRGQLPHQGPSVADARLDRLERLVERLLETITPSRPATRPGLVRLVNRGTVEEPGEVVGSDGHKAPAGVPDPTVFYSPTHFAVLLSKHYQKIIKDTDVGRAITARGLRGREDLFEVDIATATRRPDKIVSVLRWRGSIWADLTAHFDPLLLASPPQQKIPGVH